MQLPSDQRRLLMVEDNHGDMVLLRRALKQTGLEFELECITDGQTACERIGTLQVRPDLIILDLNLPKRSGWDVLDTIQATTDLRTSTVVLSSSGSPTDIAKARERNCLYIQKPMTIAQYTTIAGQLMGLLSSPGSGHTVRDIKPDSGRNPT